MTLDCIKIRVYNRACDIFQVGGTATFHKKEYDIFNAVARSCILPVDENWLTAVGTYVIII